MPVYATLGNLTVVTVAHFGAFCRGYGPKKSVSCSAKKNTQKESKPAKRQKEIGSCPTCIKTNRPLWCSRSNRVEWKKALNMISTTSIHFQLFLFFTMFLRFGEPTYHHTIIPSYWAWCPYDNVRKLMENRLVRSCNTVYGQNPAPPRMMIIPLLIGF